LWEAAEVHQPLYVVGSSGVEYALMAYGKDAGRVIAPPTHPPIREVKQLLVVSGSCSPVTARQIDAGLESGFVETPIHADRLLDRETAREEIRRVTEEALTHLADGTSPILHLCRGSQDPRRERTLRRLTEMGYSELEIRLKSGRILGPMLGTILKGVLHAAKGLERVAVTGGDTSYFVARELGIEALEMVAPVAPGSPLCRVHAPKTPPDGLEILFKGGQVGKVNLFETLRRGNMETDSSERTQTGC
jgi:uncharacterized protein YgbK (DUF1537 family)